jgi:EmrB/QacA subfamily drug resistance transporter
VTATQPAGRGSSQRLDGTAYRGGREHPGVVLGVILTCQLMVILDGTIVNIALPAIRTALHFSTANLSWVVNAYALAFGGLLLLGARAGDILGRRLTFLVGITVFTVASLAGGFAQNGPELLAARAIQGLGGAIASPSALALLMTMFRDGRERTRAIGLYTAVSIGGTAVGLIAGGVLTQAASWRWVFFVNVPIGAGVVVLAWLFVHETATVSGRFDLAGALTSTAGMTALVYGFVRVATTHWTDPAAVAAFGVGLTLLASFVIIERAAEAPITPLRLFADRDRSTSYLARLLLVAGLMGMFFFLTQFLQEILGYSPLRTGLAFLPLTVIVFGASQLSARILVERFGVRRTLMTGITCSCLGLLWITRLSAASNYYDLLGPLLVFGTGNGLAFVPLTSISLARVAPADAGAASGLVNAMQQVGGSLGLGVLVTVFGASYRHDLQRTTGLSGSAAVHHAFVAGAVSAFKIAALLVVATLLVIVALIRGDRDGHGHPADSQLIEDLETTGAITPTASQ